MVPRLPALTKIGKAFVRIESPGCRLLQRQPDAFLRERLSSRSLTLMILLIHSLFNDPSEKILPK